MYCNNFIIDNKLYPRFKDNICSIDIYLSDSQKLVNELMLFKYFLFYIKYKYYSLKKNILL